MSGHVPDLELSRFAHDPDSVPPGRAAEIERHTARCADCGTRLDFYMVAEEAPCGAEDAKADELLKPYFESPAKAAWKLRRQREFHTGGVVRKLNAQAHATFANQPLEALTHADNAQVIADLLPDDLYPNQAVYELRGTAWKERANALVRLGRLTEALESIRQAERAYQRLRSSGHGLAAVELVRAAVYYQMGELQKAASHAERAEHAYAHLGQQHRRMQAVHLRGSIKLESCELEEAAAIYQRVIEYGEETSDAELIAKGSYARANCELDLGRIGEASVLFTKAIAIFRETGPAADRVSTEWGFARVVLHGGKPTEAVHRLRDVIAAFEQMGMVTDAALAGLDMADALLVLRRPEQIEKIAAHAFRVLKKAGVLTGALTALAYLKEAAASRRVSPAVIDGVRRFLRRAEREPELLFVPP
jgi:tetratricopeptide (TPR) repeat protein